MELLQRFLQGDRRALARIVTKIESGGPQARELSAALHPHTGNAHVIGVTGSPGAGKSTLVTQVARELRRRNGTVGIVAVDPSSPFTGGAVLGDRIRMQELSGDSGVFIRSMASRGSLGGLAIATRDVVRALDAFGYNTVLIETVGAGQAEVEITRAAQTVVVVTVPGMGDGIQVIKAGILEIADVFVVNKGDRPGSDQMMAELEMMLGLDPAPQQWQVPILKTVASKGAGITQLVDTIGRHLEYLKESGTLEQRQSEQIRNELLALVSQETLGRLQERVSPAEWQVLITQVREHQLDLYATASQLTERLFH